MGRVAPVTVASRHGAGWGEKCLLNRREESAGVTGG